MSGASRAREERNNHGFAGGDYEDGNTLADRFGDLGAGACWALGLVSVEKKKMTDQEIATEIDEILTRYRVHQHWGASTGGVNKRKYAIWCGDKDLGTLRQVIDPVPHKEAQECRRNLIITDILDLMKGEKP